MRWVLLVMFLSALIAVAFLFGPMLIDRAWTAYRGWRDLIEDD